MGKLLITGDTHGQIDIGKLTTKRFLLQKELTKDDILIVLGDWGAIWYGNKKDNYMLKWWESKPWTTFIVLGNHCNYDAIEQLPKNEMFGAPVRRVSDSVIIAESGFIYNLCGKSCLVVNGADSTDKAFRIEGKSWWPQEQITEKDFLTAKENLQLCDNKVDCLLTHTGGCAVARELGFNPTISDEWVDKVMGLIQSPYQHFCGHYHINRFTSSGSRILYDDIILLSDSEQSYENFWNAHNEYGI